ncbi:hypothetical protein RB25_11605 [Herbaspirillum rubrisubalbicans]|nr:hypothetical protein RB25_11605 [Herbaspirillum rubrisubalbicans]
MCRGVEADEFADALRKQSWRGLCRLNREEVIWWSVPEQSAKQLTGGKKDSARRSGVIALTALCAAMFGETVNVQLDAKPRSIALDLGDDAAQPWRSEPRISREAGVAVELLFDAWNDWCERLMSDLVRNAGGASELSAGSVQHLLDADTQQAVTLPASLLSPWSGTLCLTVPWFGLDLNIVVSGALLEQLVQRESPPGNEHSSLSRTSSTELTTVWNALSGHVDSVAAHLQPLEATLGVLASLRVGDVLRTSHAIEKPVLISLASVLTAPEVAAAGTPLFEAYLGSQSGNRAVELL